MLAKGRNPADPNFFDDSNDENEENQKETKQRKERMQEIRSRKKDDTMQQKNNEIDLTTNWRIDDVREEEDFDRERP